MSPKLEDRNQLKRDKSLPGPGQYEFHLKAMKSAPMFGIGTEKRKDPAASKLKELGCDPGKYNPSTDSVKFQSPMFGFGS